MSNKDKTRKISKNCRARFSNPEELERDLAQWEEDITNGKEDSYNELVDEIKQLIEGARSRIGNIKKFLEDTEDMEDIIPYIAMFGNDEPDDDLGTPLHYAIANGKYDIVKSLVKAGVDVNAEDENHATPLDIAIAEANMDIVKLLLEAGADINGVRLPLLTAIQVANLEAVRLLILRGANINLYFSRPHDPSIVPLSKYCDYLMEKFITAGEEEKVAKLKKIIEILAKEDKFITELEKNEGILRNIRIINI